MKKLYFLFVFTFMLYSVNAQNPLIFKYFVSDTGGNKIRLTTQGDYTYTFVKTNNAAITGSGSGTTGLTEITVPQIGTYLVSIEPTGTFRFSNGQYNNDPDKDKITEITQWGDISWNTDLSWMFYGYTNIQITATDIPDFSNVTNMQYMFAECTNFSIANNINTWNVGNVTDMSGMFSGAQAFNKNISDWDVSKVSNMSYMFGGATLFNQDISTWNVSNVTDMSQMFQSAETFNQNIGSWNVGKVGNMSSMFYSANKFNHNIASWSTSNVTNFAGMFAYAYNFNQNISTWDVSNALSMDRMFYNTYEFNQNLGNWELSPNVILTNIFDFTSNFDCNNFGATLKGWAENPNTPLGRLIGISGRSYGTAGQHYMNQLINDKGWTFSGPTNFDPSCDEPLLSMDDMSIAKNEIKLYPNPFTDLIFIKTDHNIKAVQVFDATGKVVINGASTTEIKVHNLTSGLYFIKVTMADDTVSNHKMIKK